MFHHQNRKAIKTKVIKIALRLNLFLEKKIIDI